MAEIEPRFGQCCVWCGFGGAAALSTTCPECGYDRESAAPWTAKLRQGEADRVLLMRSGWLMGVTIQALSPFYGSLVEVGAMPRLPWIASLAIFFASIALGAVFPAWLAWRGGGGKFAKLVVALGCAVPAFAMARLASSQWHDPEQWSATSPFLYALSRLSMQALGCALLWPLVSLARGQVSGPHGAGPLGARAFGWSLVAHVISAALMLAWIPTALLAPDQSHTSLSKTLSVIMLGGGVARIVGTAAELLAIRQIVAASPRGSQALGAALTVLIAALMIEAILTPVMMAMIEWSTAAGTIRTLLDDWDVVAFLYWFVLAAVHLAAMWAVRRQVRRMTASDR